MFDFHYWELYWTDLSGFGYINSGIPLVEGFSCFRNWHKILTIDASNKVWGMTQKTK